MAILWVVGDQLQVRFSPFEKVFGLVRDHDFPLSSVSSASLAVDGLAAVEGLRAPGLGLPGVRKVGTWRGHGRTLVSVRRRQPAVVVDLEGEHYGRVVVSDEDATSLVDQLQHR